MSDDNTRKWLGEATIIGSFVVLIVISAFVIFYQKNAEGVKTVFNSVLPLLGTWIGTVLAFYFSRQSFATAASMYKDVAATAGDLTTTSVTSAMTRRSKITAVDIPESGPSGLLIKDHFLDKVTATITRFPVLDSAGAIKYIVHASTLYEYAYRLEAATGGGPTLATATLEHFLGDAKRFRLAEAFAIVSSSSFLSDAKQKMDATPGCKDVFVTKTGAANEPVLGWITDAILAAHANV